MERGWPGKIKYFPKTTAKQFFSQVVQSICPANGQVIAEVTQGNLEDYETCVQEAEKAWQVWADLPAPKRGEIVRQIGDALRSKLNILGKLVAIEMGLLQRK